MHEDKSLIPVVMSGGSLPSVVPNSVGLARWNNVLERKDHWNREWSFFIT